MSVYKHKYEKYKSKYLNLYNGGGDYSDQVIRFNLTFSEWIKSHKIHYGISACFRDENGNKWN